MEELNGQEQHLDTVREIFFKLDNRFNIVFANRKALQTWQKSKEEAIGKNILEVHPQSASTPLNGIFEKSFSEQKKVIKEIAFPAEGTWMLVNVNPTIDGIVVLMVDISKLVSARKQDGVPTSETKLAGNITEDSNELLKATLESSLDSIQAYKAMRQPEGEIIDFVLILSNHQSLITAAGNDQLILLSNQYGNNNSELLKRFIEVTETGIPQQFEFHDLNTGEEKWLFKSVVKMDDGIVVTTADITQRKKAEVELNKQHNILKQSEELASTGSWEYNLKTKEFTWSDGMYALFEIPKSTLIRPDIYIDYAATEMDAVIAKDVVKKIQADPKSFDHTMKLRVDGHVKIIKIKSSPFKNEASEIDRVLGVDMDITDVKTAEKKIEELNKILLFKNRELAALNSELQTLQSITSINYQETLKQLYASLEYIITKDAPLFSHNSRGHLRRSQAAIQRMQLFTEDIVAFSKIRIDENLPEPISLNNVMDQAIADMQEKINDHAITVHKSELPVINGYPPLLALLFHHLLDNAIKFIEENNLSEIKIEYEKVMELHPDHPNESPAPYHKITILDNGKGFKQEEAENIFEMFYKITEKGKFRGSGIGLAICKKIMDIHQGFITAIGKPDMGAAFHCYFPSQHA